MNELNLTSLNLSSCQFDDLAVSIHPNAEYNATHDGMVEVILKRIADKKNEQAHTDELWLVEHQDVYTLGQAGKEEHILYQTGTPIIKTDRGGQVTWHGFGQLVVYWLVDLRARGLGVRDLVSHAEQAIEDVVGEYLPETLYAKARRDAPGVYIYNHNHEMLGKIASLGFKIKQGFSYHGVAINLINDLTAFNAINPCGYAGMQMVKLANFGKFTKKDIEAFTQKFIINVHQRLNQNIALRSI